MAVGRCILKIAISSDTGLRARRHSFCTRGGRIVAADDEPTGFVLGVDLDGVCADFMAGLRPIAAEWLSKPIWELTPTPKLNAPDWDWTTTSSNAFMSTPSNTGAY